MRKCFKRHQSHHHHYHLIARRQTSTMLHGSSLYMCNVTHALYNARQYTQTHTHIYNGWLDGQTNFGREFQACILECHKWQRMPRKEGETPNGRQHYYIKTPLYFIHQRKMTVGQSDDDDDVPLQNPTGDKHMVIEWLWRISSGLAS